ncbi:transposase [Shigella sonnei]|nr:transposase [Shigella sonnei]
MLIIGYTLNGYYFVLRSGVSELQLPCFTAVRAEIALMSGSAFAVTHHPVSS